LWRAGNQISQTNSKALYRFRWGSAYAEAFTPKKIVKTAFHAHSLGHVVFARYAKTFVATRIASGAPVVACATSAPSDAKACATKFFAKTRFVVRLSQISALWDTHVRAVWNVTEDCV
jgi:uncharacterized protein with von Willebrand factor type A (vWA) domain